MQIEERSHFEPIIAGEPIGFELLVRGDEIGLRLEYVEGVPVWEAWPAKRHVMATDVIRASIRRTSDVSSSGCGCIHYPDLYVRFPDGSIKRPDIAVYCVDPPELDEAVTGLPDAVIEILSLGYEAKDTEIGKPFYLKHGVKDVILFDPRSGEVVHARRDGERRLQSPVTIDLECGCRCTV
jgi:Uma2 family endonuclease